MKTASIEFAIIWFFLARALIPVGVAAGETTPGEQHEFRGRIVCLAEEMQKEYRAPVPANHQHLVGFKTTEGKYYTLLRTKTSEALFVDKRLLEKELMLTNRASEVFVRSRV